MLGVKENDKSFEINNFYVIFFVIIFFEIAKDIKIGIEDNDNILEEDFNNCCYDN